MIYLAKTEGQRKEILWSTKQKPKDIVRTPHGLLSKNL